MKRKICVVITARPSYSRMRTALEAIQGHQDLELLLVVSSSALLNKYGQVVNTIREDGFPISETVYNLIEGENHISSAKTTGLGIIELSSVFDRLRPDAVITIADRYETIATAIAASYLNIPLVHIQGGEITGNIDEKVRHAITKLSDIHFVATEKAGERVVRMGEPQEKVFVTGCPSLDIVKMVLDRNNGSRFDPLDKYHGVGSLLSKRDDYIIVLQHPVTTEVGEASTQIYRIYDAVKDLPFQIYWFWPNVDAGSDEVAKAIRSIRENYSPQNIYFFKNLAPDDFIRLLDGAKCIVGNSSVGIREASFLGVPAVNIGSRQDGRERGKNVVDVPHISEQILKAIKEILCNEGCREREPLYGDGNAGHTIAELLCKVELTYRKRLQY